jgi:PPOX class probable F420-dependent enzyme
MSSMPDQVRALFDGPNYAHVASVLPSGAPHSVPVWVTMEGDYVAIFTQTTTRKARNLERDPRVAISITDHTHPYRMASMRGKVVDRRFREEALAVMDRMALKYTGKPFPYRGPTAVLFLIEVDRVKYTELPFTHQPG